MTFMILETLFTFVSRWDPNGPATGLHSMNRLRVPFIRDGLIHTGHGHGGVALPLKGLTILVQVLKT